MTTAGRNSGPLTATYTLTPATVSVDEGSSVTFTVGGTHIDNGSYFWTIETNAGDFATSSGEVIISSNSGSFSVTPTADTTTEGAETFTVSLRSTSITGTVLVTSNPVTINDTSLSLQPPFSLSFNGSSSYLGVQNTQSDWALNRTWTIEFWSKANTASSGGNLLTVMCQDYTDGNSIQILYQNGFQIKGGTTLAAEPTPGVWTHVALVSTVGDGVTLYYNGVSQSTGGYYSLNNSSADLAIGKRGPGNFQYFNGKLALIRISSTAKYTADFTPSITYGVEGDTRLMLGSTTPLVDSYGEHPIDNQGAVISQDFPSLQARSLEFVENQNDYLEVAGSSDWNLGTTWTIEFWLKANASSLTAFGGIWGLLNQGGWSTTNNIVVALSDAKLVFLSRAWNANDDVRYTEPPIGGVPSAVSNISSPGGWNGAGNWTNLATTGGTGTGMIISVLGAQGGYANAVGIITPGSGYTSGDIITAVGESSVSFTISSCSPIGVWTHVAISNDAGTQKVFYNGVEQTRVSGNVGSAEYTNGSTPIRIGRLGPANGGTLNGKMALVRISDTAKYLAPFTPSKTYGVESDTKLFLNSFSPTVDAKSHAVTNNGVTTSTDFPTVQQTLVALAYTQNNGYASNYGGNQISVLVADYPTIGNVPNGATVTITGQGSGTFTVNGSYVQSGLRFFTVGTLDFTAWGSDTLTFTWYA